jgi:cation transport ATPase
MLSGGQALRDAVRSASSVLEALARRYRRRHRPQWHCAMRSAKIVAGDRLVVFPHETCPADGIVLEGHQLDDQSYLTGEPTCCQVPGVAVLSGAINGEGALTIRAERGSRSRFAKIMQECMRESNSADLGAEVRR